MKTSLNKITVIHSDFLAAVFEMDIKLTQWEKKNGPNPEQRERIEALRRAADQFEALLGSTVYYYEQNLILESRICDVVKENGELKAQLEEQKEKLRDALDFLGNT